MQLRLTVLVLLFPALICAHPASAQKKGRPDRNGSGYDNAARATVLHTANVYVTADSAAPPITTVATGHEVVVQQKNGAWVNVFANTDVRDDADPDARPEFEDPRHSPQPSSGWIRDKGIVGPLTPHGDVILYGTAAELEAQAAQPHAPSGAAAAAHRLYQRVVDYFPDSPLAPEALFRAADIRWQLDKLDIATLPSAHEQEAYLRPQLYEGELRRVIKLYPHSDFEARAAFDLLDEKLCGDWQGLPKCPEQETTLYLRYADQYRGGPRSADALYAAAYRQAVLVTMYTVDDDPKRAAAAANNCQSIADQMQQVYPKSDFSARATSLAFKVAQGIPVTGNDRD